MENRFRKNISKWGIVVILVLMSTYCLWAFAQQDAGKSLSLLKPLEPTLLAGIVLALLTIGSGALGGYIFSVNQRITGVVNQDSHSLDSAIRAMKPRVFFFVGVGGSVVAQGAGVMISLVKLQYLVLQTSVDVHAVADFLQTGLVISMLGVVGGYSGTRLIGIVSNSLELRLRQLQKDFDSSKQSVLSSLEKQEHEAERTWKEIKGELEQAKEELEYVSATNNIDIKTHESLEVFLRYLEKHKDKSEPPIWAGMAYKRLGLYDKALEFLDLAEKIDPDYWVIPFNRACYKCLRGDEIDSIIKELRLSMDKAWGESQDRHRKDFRNWLQHDSDLDSIRETKEFQDFQESLDKKGR